MRAIPMRHGYDINQLPTDGFLIFPLSMSRLHKGQKPERLYKDLEFFDEKITKISLDVVFLYTNTLYMNTGDTALEVKEKTNNQMINHRNELWNLILQERDFVPQAFHFETWDHLIVQAGQEYLDTRDRLEKAMKKDSRFEELLEEDLGSKEKTEENLNFLIEEIAMTHLLRQKKIRLPNTLASPEGWRLILYHGGCMKADTYALQNGILTENPDIDSNEIFSHSHYNLEEQVLEDLKEIEL